MDNSVHRWHPLSSVTFSLAIVNRRFLLSFLCSSVSLILDQDNPDLYLKSFSTLKAPRVTLCNLKWWRKVFSSSSIFPVFWSRKSFHCRHNLLNGRKLLNDYSPRLVANNKDNKIRALMKISLPLMIIARQKMKQKECDGREDMKENRKLSINREHLRAVVRRNSAIVSHFT